MMKEEDKKKFIKEGKFNFVVKRWTLYFGGFMSLFLYFYNNLTLHNNFFRFDSFDILSTLFINLILGTIFGLIMWWYINRK